MSQAQDLLNDQQTFVSALQAAGSTTIFNYTNAMRTMAQPPIVFVPMNPPEPYPPGNPGEAPSFVKVDPPDPGEIPEMAGELTAISETFSGAAPTFYASVPVLNFGNMPSQIPEFSGSAPGITTSFVFPDMPATQVFTAPTLRDLAAPDDPDVVTPSFDALMPVNEAVAPRNLDVAFKRDFSEADAMIRSVAESHMDAFLVKINPQYHTQLARIETQLATYLAGGTGLAPEVEDAIYARAQAKNDLEAKRVQDAAFADNAARGFTLPSGALTSALARARQDAANNNAKAANEIAIAQAEMEQKNLQFAVTTSADLRKAAVNSIVSFLQTSLSMTGMALDYAKNIMASLVQIYDIEVKVFNAKLDAYKTEATVFDIKSRVAMQIVEIFKARIQAMEALTNVDKTKVEMYRAQIGSLKDYADIYKTQVEAVVSKASLEKLKIDLFQGQIQAYSAQVQAKSAEWQGYQARIGGEEAKVKIYSAQADAFNGEVNAFKAQHEAVGEKIKAESMRNNALVQGLTARVGAYEANVRAQATVASANIENLRQAHVSFKGVIDHAIATEQMKLEAYKANVQALVMNAKQDIDGKVAAAQSAGQAMAAAGHVFGKAIEVYSGPASAAAAGMNSLASINYQE